MDSDGLTERLKALGVHLGIAGLRKNRSYCQPIDILKELGLSEVKTTYGSAFFTEQTFPLTDELRVFIQDFHLMIDLIARWSNLKSLTACDYSDLLFLDTETTGLSGGTGTLIFMVGMGYLTESSFKVTQFFLDHPDHEVPFLAAVGQYISPYKSLVTYNGKAFDIPLLTSRFILNDLFHSMQDYLHLDFLHIARKLWKTRIEKRRLVDLEVSILNIARSANEIAGYQIPDVYFDYLELGECDLLPKVFYHNGMDIYSLARLLAVGANSTLLKNRMEIDQRDLVSIARMHEDIESYQKASELYEMGLSADLPETLQNKTMSRLGRIYKKQQNWDMAINLWKTSAEQDFNSCIELAKYYEHKVKDYQNALFWAKKAEKVKLNKTSIINSDMAEKLEARLNRLKIKLEKHSKGVDKEL